ncbi:hypothetical protein E1091_15910 [Micromonospora fluostatini]|uniref:Uncharacterized protein n=1 Tax=Micromonospora fluostatini TaxID=1629071 RepID=A0ABY2DED0_9ACTN|nr:hypothetical protein E1091_15910 [Micromonospora fluostatini]
MTSNSASACRVSSLLDTPVVELVSTSHTGYEVEQKDLCSRVDVGELDPHDGVGISMIEEIRWVEFGIGPYDAATSEVVRAVERVLTDIYNASDVTITEDGDDTYLSVEWHKRVPPTDILGEVIELLLRQDGDYQQGPAGFHNATNGAYNSRNAYRDVREAVREVALTF